MLAPVNYLRGYCEVEIRGKYPERFLNICARGGVEFWKTERLEGGGYRVRVRRGVAPRLEGFAPRTMCEAKVVRRVGTPFFAERFKKRWLFLAGIALFLLGLWYMSGRVWEFEVEGNETVSAERVLRELETLGVGIGVRSADIDAETLGDEMLLRIPELRWFTVNVNGSIATAELRERVEPPKEETKGAPRNLVALRDGIIEEIVALDGAGVVKKGDTVLAGDLLVSGIMDTATGARLVYARGSVTARTWRVLEAAAPLGGYVKTPTGAETTKYSVIFAGKRINLYFSRSNLPALCDKIITRTRLALSEKLTLPIILERAVYSEYTEQYAPLDKDGLKNALEKTLRERLRVSCGAAEIIKTEIAFREDAGVLIASLTAECIEELASPAEIPSVFTK